MKVELTQGSLLDVGVLSSHLASHHPLPTSSLAALPMLQGSPLRLYLQCLR